VSQNCAESKIGSGFRVKSAKSAEKSVSLSFSHVRNETSELFFSVGAKNGRARITLFCILYKPLVCDGIKPDQRREKRGRDIYLCVF